MNKAPLFSVLIAQYNNGKYLQEAINSIKEQTYTNWEIVLVDDGSTDNSKEVYKLYENDERIKIFYNEENKGCGYTKRRCAELATGEICGFLDPDDLLVPNAVEIMINLHKQNPQASLIYSNHIRTDENLKNEKKLEPHPIKSDYLSSHSGYISVFATFKRDLYLKTKGIDAKFKRAVDQDLYYKLEEVGNVIYDNSYLYIYRIHSGGISVNNNELLAYSWKLAAMIDACERRNISLEKIIAPQLYYHFIHNLRYEVKVGKFLLTPIRKIKKLLNSIFT
ncbi:MAG: glycosyltransferase [Prevotella sp.]|jgi:glycosyltransferase involved in cell wall biosynthesis|nr:glycosyltransferase [Prevotella sp.]